MYGVLCVRDFLAAKCNVGRALGLGARLLILMVAAATLCSAQEARKAIENPPPVYPPFARHLDLTGTVKLRAVVTAEGQVKQVEVVGGHPLLVNAAVDAVKKWKYAPAKME